MVATPGRLSSTHQGCRARQRRMRASSRLSTNGKHPLDLRRPNRNFAASKHCARALAVSLFLARGMPVSRSERICDDQNCHPTGLCGCLTMFAFGMLRTAFGQEPARLVRAVSPNDGSRCCFEQASSAHPLEIRRHPKSYIDADMALN